ncbi:ABC transporter ATP-binding protein [Dethiothermospora halolimnae]|uniref:ABC transporter ATP-binding protein n=1 Tax=Dethiothermospora halolimnae TaxID=3114390 RepID=UPI003CCB75AB
MIEIKGLTKQYGKVRGVEDINFTINKGEVLGLLGPNGAGKSTTMKMITGFMPSTEGTVIIDNLDIIDNDKEAKKKIGYVPEHPPLYQDMTVTEYLYFVSELKGVTKKERKENVDYAIERLQLHEMKDRLIRNLSKGYRQRVGLAQSIIGESQLLVLDEPTVGLDPRQVIEIREFIKELAKDHTIIISSHVLSEIRAVCNRVVIMNKGKIVAIDTPDNLSKTLSKSSRLHVRIAGEEDKVVSTIKEIPGIQSVIVEGEIEEGTVDYDILTDTDYDVRKRLFFDMSKAGFPILEMRTIELSLEEIFIELTDEDKEIKLNKEDVKEGHKDE